MTRFEQKRRALQRFVSGMISRFNPFLDPNDYVMRVLHAQMEALEDHKAVSDEDLTQVISNLADITSEIKVAEAVVREHDLRISSLVSSKSGSVSSLTSRWIKVGGGGAFLRDVGRKVTFGLIDRIGAKNLMTQAEYDAERYKIESYWDDLIRPAQAAREPDARKLESAKSRGEQTGQRKSLIEAEIVRIAKVISMKQDEINTMEEIKKIADELDVDIQLVMRRAPDALTMVATEQYSLKDLEELCQWSRDHKDDTNKPKSVTALQRFVNHVVIPHLDYFIIHALSRAPIIEGSKIELDPNDYPVIGELVHHQVVLTASPRDTSTPDDKKTPPLDFGFLLDPKEGQHIDRLKRALAMVNGQVQGFEVIVEDLMGKIHEIIGQIESQGQIRGNLRDSISRAGAHNSRLDEKLAEQMSRYGDIEQWRQKLDTSPKLLDGFLYTLSKVTRGIPGISGALELITDQREGVQLIQRRGVELARAEQRAAEISGSIGRLESQKIDIVALERQVRAIDVAVDQLIQSAKFKELERDKTKQKAISDAFIAKYVLSFGMQVSSILEEGCKKRGVASIDELLDGFGDKQRLKDAVTNLSFGFADSNDLSVILAEVNFHSRNDGKLRQVLNVADSARYGKHGQSMQVLQTFVDDYLRPNIGEFYAHGSKVDLIYQANLTGLGTKLHAARRMVRSEHDTRVGALFGDSFGVGSKIHSLTVRGAVDVKHLFDFYLHRHGDVHMSDERIQDGIASPDRPKKAVSVLTADDVTKHVEATKSARGYRQTPPDISDMFIRICGYEYFYPQAPNNNSETNIMIHNPEAPASYVMVNDVVQSFIKKLSFGDIDTYRKKIGPQLDNLIAQTFMDFFHEVGQQHASDPVLGQKRADLKQAASETSTHGFVFDSYTRHITDSAISQFDLFQNIFACNLEKQLECAPRDVRLALQKQIRAIDSRTKGQLTEYEVAVPGTKIAVERAYDRSHTFENTSWKGSSL